MEVIALLIEKGANPRDEVREIGTQVQGMSRGYVCQSAGVCSAQGPRYGDKLLADGYVQ